MFCFNDGREYRRNLKTHLKAEDVTYKRYINTYMYDTEIHLLTA